MCFFFDCDMDDGKLHSLNLPCWSLRQLRNEETVARLSKSSWLWDSSNIYLKMLLPYSSVTYNPSSTQRLI